MSVDTTKVAPFAPDTPDLLAESMTHLVRARVIAADGTTTELDVEGGTLSYDEQRSPMVEVSLTCRMVNDQAFLDALDARALTRLEIDLGYLRPDGLADVQTVANLALQYREVERPPDTFSIDACGDEQLVIDASPVASSTLTNANTTGAITSVLTDAIGTVTPYLLVSSGAAVSGVIFEDRWEVINDLADTLDAWVYDDGLRNWYIAPSPTISTVACELKVGSRGTILESTAGLGRDGWFNCVYLRYEWTDSGGLDHVINATRRVTTGDYAAVTGNTRTLAEVREVATTQTKADAAAAALVARTVTRGRAFRVRAISAYWLRPGHTVEVTLPLGDPEQHLVASVDFDLRDGSMSVVTRLPDNTSTIGA